MPEQENLFKNELAYNSLTYTSVWIDVSSSQKIIFVAFADVNFDMTINWSVDDTFNIITTDSLSVVANNSGEFNQSIKSRFMQVHMIFSSNPVDFQNQVFFF
jgi:hypothetical protein